MFSRFRPPPAMFVACLALVIALGGTAVATISSFVGPDGTIHGCVTSQGQLTLVKPGTRCAKGSPIAWNERGPKGARGPQGIQGIKGDTGAPGPGAISVNETLKPSFGDVKVVHGVTAYWSCTDTNVEVAVTAQQSGSYVFVSGDKAENGTLTSLQTASTGNVDATATSTANLDVIAMADGTWSRFDLGGYHGSTGCNVWGVLTPGT